MIKFVQTAEEAEQAVDEGYLAIECSFGDTVVVNDEKEPFDHHGPYSSFPSATTQAFESNKKVNKVVVNHVDFDNVFAGALLLGIVSRSNKWIKKLAKMVAKIDLEGPGSISAADRKSDVYELYLHFTGNMSGPPSESKYKRGLDLVKSFEKGPSEETGEARKREQERLDYVRQPELIQESKGRFALIRSEMFGYDQWYKKHDVIVVFFEQNKAISIGVTDDKTAEEMFGPGGLKNVFPKLGPGWGGRESVGGSPRNKKMTYEQARDVFKKVQELATHEKKAVVLAYLRRRRS